eukprot:CAMPEP_0116146684 /NCGR_PEP_ID=MMETSP0329-20121206/17301_1 /TAXON_ID=697910 /ORGANISM="Pseudo-nitzschia arenysensis, Strain B593" /LENGTH=213 /DNA_ID=CAMNT_0003642459 /DNA_START=39 /DNA_END=680 /DNA_ORIENTATION=+
MASKTFEALGLLQNYVDASETAHGELKSCLWQLTKSRRNVRSGILGVDSTTAYTAELLREELRAQIRVVNDANDSIELVDEDSTTPKDKKELQALPQWKLQNIVAKLDQEIPETDQSTDKKTTETTGMRNRKGGATSLEACQSSSWTMIEEEDLQEEEKIIRTDPIKLFGGYFPALELKVAQKNARDSLTSYIKAANEAAKLLELLREVETKK